MSGAARWIAAIALAWLAVIGAALAYAWALVALALDGQRAGRAFHVASESMWPTLAVGDRLVPRRMTGGAIGRGMVVVVSMPDNARIYHVAGLGGDRVEMRGGRLVLNGKPVPQMRRGTGPIRIERFPGERGVHRIADRGPGPGDDMATVTVPAGRLFLLGDNRDRSADSRYPAEELGVGMVDQRAVIGAIDTVIRRQGWGLRAVPVDGALQGGGNPRDAVPDQRGTS